MQIRSASPVLSDSSIAPDFRGVNYIDEVISYFRYLCTQHPLLLHSDTAGSRVFEVRDLDGAFGALRSGVKEKDFLVRFVLPTMTIRRYDNNAWKVYQCGMVVLKYHGKRETEDADVTAAMKAAEKVADEFVERMVCDSRNGYPLFGRGIDDVSNMNVTSEFISFSQDGTYSGVLVMFDLPTFRKLVSYDTADCAAVAWLDDGLTSF